MSAAPGPEAHGGHAEDRRCLVLAVAAIMAFTLARLAVLAISPLDLYFDEAQYWDWAQEPAFGYYSKPPMIAWLIAASTLVCGDGVFCIKAPIPLVYAVASLFVFGAARALYGSHAALWASLLFVSLPGVSFSSLVASTDPPLLACWAAALYCLARLQQEPGQDGQGHARRTAFGLWAGLGLAVGLGLLSKYAMGFFIAGMAVWLVLDAGARRRLMRLPTGGFGPLLAAALAFLLYLPNLLWNVAAGFVTYAHTGDNANLGADWFRPDLGLAFLASQFGLYGPVLFAILIGLLVTTRWWRDGRSLLLAVLVLVMFLPILFLAFLTRANANWAAPLAVAGSIWVAGVLATRMHRGGHRGGHRDWYRGWLIASMALHLLVAGVLYGGLAWRSAPGVYAGIAIPSGMDPFLHHEGWSEIGTSVAALRDAHPGTPLLFDERGILAPMLYYGGARPVPAYAWHPDERITDHYRMTRPWPDRPGGHALIVTRFDNIGHILDRFEAHERVAEIEVAIGTERTRRVLVFHARGFAGYNTPMAADGP